MDSGADQNLQNLQNAPVSNISPVENEPDLKQKLISIIQKIKEREILTRDYIIDEGIFSLDQKESLKYEYKQTIKTLDEVLSLLKNLQLQDEKKAEEGGRALGFLWSRFPNIFKSWKKIDEKEQEKKLDEISTKTTDLETKKQVSILKAAMVSAGATFVLHQAADAYFNRPSNTKGVQYHMQITKATGVSPSKQKPDMDNREENNDTEAATSVGILEGIFSGLGWPSFLTWSRYKNLSAGNQTEELEDLNTQVNELPVEQQAAAENPMRNLIRYTLVVAGPAGATVGLLELARKYGVPQPWEAAAGLVSSAQTRAGAGKKKCYKCGCRQNPSSFSARAMAVTARAGSSWRDWVQQDVKDSFPLSKVWNDGNFFKNLFEYNMIEPALSVTSVKQAATVFGELQEKAQALADVRKGLGERAMASPQLGSDWDKEVSAYRHSVGDIVDKLKRYGVLKDAEDRELLKKLKAVPSLPHDTEEDIKDSQAKIDRLFKDLEAKIPHFNVDVAEGEVSTSEIPQAFLEQVKKSEGIKSVRARLVGTMLLLALSAIGLLYRMYYNEQRTLRRLKANLKAAYEEYKKNTRNTIGFPGDKSLLGGRDTYISHKLEAFLLKPDRQNFKSDREIKKSTQGKDFAKIEGTFTDEAKEKPVYDAQEAYINFLLKKLRNVHNGTIPVPSANF